MPAIVKILIVFAAMLSLTRVKVPLSIALIFGGITMNLWAGLSFAETMSNTWQSILSYELWLFIGITVLIIELGRFMTEKRNSDAIISATKRWGGKHGRATTIMAVPAVIGLIPMPAGALFSAPFVAQASDKLNESGQWKTAVNYWFRHIWEYWWPLYPGVIIAMSLFEMIETWKFAAVMFFFTPVVAFSGYFFLVRPHIKDLTEKPEPQKGKNKRAILVISPLLVTIAFVLTLPTLTAKLLPDMDNQTGKLLAILVGLLIGLLIIIAESRILKEGKQKTKVFSSIFKKKSMSVILSIAGVLIFKFMLMKAELLPLAGKELVQSGIPIIIAVAGLPFIAGFVTGVAFGFTGISFPLVVGLLMSGETNLTPISTLVLAYGFGYMGMMLSPVHLCLLVTKDYFETSLGSVYLKILPCVCTVLFYCLSVHILFKMLSL